MNKELKGIPCDGEKISLARRNKPASQNEVAVAVGVQRETVSGWEEPGIKGLRAGHFRRLIEFLGVAPEAIKSNQNGADAATYVDAKVAKLSRALQRRGMDPVKILQAAIVTARKAKPPRSRSGSRSTRV